MTQPNSRNRVKVDTVGEDGLKNVFESYSNQSLEDFRKTCINIIELSTGSKETKLTFISILMKAVNKDIMLKKVTNYVLAGQGLGV